MENLAKAPRDWLEVAPAHLKAPRDRLEVAPAHFLTGDLTASGCLQMVPQDLVSRQRGELVIVETTLHRTAAWIDQVSRRS